MANSQNTLLDLIEKFERMRLCGPGDDPDEQHQVIYGMRACLKSFKRAIIKIGSLDLQNYIQQIKEPETLEDALDVDSDINAILPELRAECNDRDEAAVEHKPNEPLKAFISYLTANKNIASEIKKLLEKELNIECFLAHEDIGVSQEWRESIVAELELCDIFIPILCKDFKNSDWTSQEVGFAVSNPNTLIIPVSLDDTIAFGLIAHIQSKRINDKDDKLELFMTALIERFPHSIIPIQINRVSLAKSFRGAEALMLPLVPHFSKFNHEEIAALVDASIKNGQVWSANLCKSEFLPKFLEMHKTKIDPKKFDELQYQITSGNWYWMKDKKGDVPNKTGTFSLNQEKMAQLINNGQIHIPDPLN